MKRRTDEWIKKAEGDWRIAQREMQARDPVWDGVCFHAQQCAEKYLEAFLEERNISFEKAHDLVVLVNSCSGMLGELDSSKEALGNLSTFGIATRYPGVQADRQAAENALKIAENVRAVVRAKFGLD